VTALLAVVLAAAAAVLVAARRTPRRLDDVLAVRVRRTEGRRSPIAARRTSPARASCALAALLLLVVLPSAVGAVAASAVLLGGPRLLAGLEPRSARAERDRLRADLPLVLDLLGACLAGGAPLTAAADAVGRAVPGPAGHRLLAVAGALQVGTPAATAWQALAAGDPDDVLAPAARTLARAAESGAAVAGVLARLGDDARRQSRAAGAEAARRAGVLAVAPLGLCFLPAFVLLGVVPVVVGLAAPVLRG
jgi:pilus assembly protein TadC